MFIKLFKSGRTVLLGLQHTDSLVTWTEVIFEEILFTIYTISKNFNFLRLLSFKIDNLGNKFIYPGGVSSSKYLLHQKYLVTAICPHCQCDHVCCPFCTFYPDFYSCIKGPGTLPLCRFKDMTISLYCIQSLTWASLGFKCYPVL